MKLINILSFAALSTAFVVPDEQVFNRIAVESHRGLDSLYNTLPTKEDVVSKVENGCSKAIKFSKNTFDRAVEYTEEIRDDVLQRVEKMAIESQTWPQSDHGHHGHHGHGHKPNQTIYQLISSSKYTTRLTELINGYPDLVHFLNGTSANYTVFAPIDKAFEKIPEHAPKPSKEEIKEILLYHISSEFYPAGRVLVTHTIPSSLSEDSLGGELQRLSTNIGLRGLTVNFYSRIIAIDIFATNGVIHGVEDIIIPPPKSVEIFSILPGEFSTLELALTKTGLLDILNDTSLHVGGTIFAPSNFAFLILGPRINAFLFSSHGLKYLKALLQYHVVPNHTLYSDAYYQKDKPTESASIPKGFFHVDLPTLLDDKSLSVDVGRFGRLINIKVNGFTSVTIEDGIARDGVIQVISNVIIPPKHIGGLEQQWMGEELTVEDLKERLEPFVGKEDL